MAVGDPQDFDLAAAGLRADGSDEMQSLEVLARKLEDALPGRCSVRRRARRLLSRDKRVEAVDLNLGDWAYTLRSDGHAITALRGQTVRGVTIKRDEMALADWVRSLAAELTEMSASSAEARQALDRLLGA